MAALVDRIAGTIDRMNGLIGSIAGWMATFMVVIQFGTVVMRFVFGENLILVQDMVLYLHGMVFMLGAGYLLMRDGHVRVDLIYRDLSVRQKHWIDLGGSVLLLIPFSLVLLILSLPYTFNSWLIFESSREFTGLPLTFVLKTTIPIFALLILLQCIANVLRLSMSLMRGGAS